MVKWMDLKGFLSKLKDVNRMKINTTDSKADIQVNLLLSTKTHFNEAIN